MGNIIQTVSSQTSFDIFKTNHAQMIIGVDLYQTVGADEDKLP